MRHFACACGNRAFFDNTTCLQCGRELGFDPDALAVVSIAADGDGGFLTPGGRRLRRCRNYDDYGNCNWLVASDATGVYCRSCALTEMRPNLSRGDNLMLWSRLEQAKRRLLHTLMTLDLPLDPVGTLPGLRFRFLEDQTRNPDVMEEHVITGHADGVITVNLEEADDSARHTLRVQLLERYRTVLGHLRHEVGHYYFDVLARAPEDLDRCRALFGDERLPYDQAMREYYAGGPETDWQKAYVSAYASAHPQEDFAETFAHYLHIRDALETAEAGGLADPHVPWLDRWIGLAITLNEVSRSLGTEDAYPFVLTPTVMEKLELIHLLVSRRA